MSATDVLLIDHDEVVLGLLRGSIIGKNPGAKIEIAKNKTEAYFLFQFQKYQFIFCDYDILIENDYDLLSHIHSNQDDSTNIIVTYYGDQDALKFGNHPAPQLVLPKPIDQRNLSTILSQIFKVQSQNAPSEIHFSEETSRQIEITLKELQRNTNVRCVIISNTEGRVLVQQGETENISVDTLTSLVSGSIMTLEEVGRIFNDPTVINLAFREGAKSDLYALNIGHRLLLIMIQDKSTISPKLGTVWFYARQTAITIDQLIKDTNPLNSTHKSRVKK